jgi:tripartite-type tricarboxylate transporter receptor subunit TctC
LPASDDRDFRQRMYIDRAVEPSGVKLDEFARFIRDEREAAERMVRESGLQPK